MPLLVRINEFMLVESENLYSEAKCKQKSCFSY